jgi:hypothetical protein
MAKAIVNVIDGLPVDEKAEIHLEFDQDFFIVEEIGRKGFKSHVINEYKIPLNNIMDTTLTTQKELIERQKSVIGRGVVGGFLFGPAGLILGGMSGIGSKQKTKHNDIYVISFAGSDGTLKNLTFGMPGPMRSVTNGFDKKLKKQLSGVQKSDAVKALLDIDSGTTTTIL